MVDNKEYWRIFVGGGDQAFKALYDAYYPVLKQYALGYAKDESLASECVQDLFVKLWNNRGSLNAAPASVKHYLIKAQRNIIINKTNQRRKESYVGHTEELMATHEGVYFHEEDPVPFSAGMRKRMAQLTERQREAIYLFYGEEYSYAELAEHFDIQTTAAYKLVYRALDTLKADLREEV